MTRKVVALVALVFAFSGLLACAPQGAFEAQDSNLSPSTTGFLAQNGAPYTVGGDARLMQSPQPSVRPASNNSAAPLPSQITSVLFVRINDKNKVDRFGAKEFRAHIELTGLGKISFQGPLTAISPVRVQAVSPLKSPQGFELEVEFDDNTNDNYFAGHLRLHSLDSKGQRKTNADIFVRSFRANLEVNVNNELDLHPVNKRYVRLLNETGVAWVTNTVVQQGRSFYDTQVWSLPDPERNPKPDRIDDIARGRRLFSFSGEAVRTGDFEDKPASQLVNGLLRITKADLIGDAETTDQRTFAVEIKGEVAQLIDVAITVEKPDTTKVPIARQPPAQKLIGLSPSSYLNVKYTDPRYPRVKKMIDDFEKNFSLPGVKLWINEYTVGKRAEQLKVALKNASPFRQIIETIFHTFDVAPPAVLLTFIESRFFTANGYPLETNPESTASGPAQLLTGTAASLGLKVFKNQKGVLPRAGDHRLFFIPSACGTAAHLAKSLGLIAQHDSTFALAAYYQGDGGVADKIHRALTGEPMPKRDPFGKVLKYKITYRQAANQRMLPSDWINYVNKALALYFVTGNPTQFNVNWAEDKSLGLPKDKLLPRDQIQNPTCRRAIYEMVATRTL